MGINSSSLSSQLIQRVIESDWLTASRVEIKKYAFNDKPQDILNSQVKRNVVVYHIHNLTSTIVRVIAVIAIDIIVPPVGVVYHSIQALRHKNWQRSEHLLCMGGELIKTLLAVSLIALPIIFSPKVQAFFDTFNPLLVEFFFNFYGTVLPLAFMGAAFEIGATAFSPHSSFGSPDAQWVAKMGLKWVLGVQSPADPEKILRDISNKYSKNILKNLSEIQALLPGKHLLPYDEKVKVSHILQFLEQSRHDLPVDVWNSIKPFRESLIENNEMLTRLERYMKSVPSRFNSTEVAQAYTVDGLKPLVTERPAYDLHINSLSMSLYKAMLSSDWFYASNYETQTVNDKASLVGSLRDFDPFVDRKAKPSSSTLDKTSSVILIVTNYAMRFFGTLAIKVIGAPIGTVKNLALTAVYLGLTAIQGQDARFGNWAKVKAYAFATFNDFTNIFTGWSLAFYPYPESGVENIASSEGDRVGLFKAMILKHRFGVVGPNGQLLAYSTIDDLPEQKMADKYFWNLRTSQSLILHHHLRRINDTLKPDEQSHLDAAFGSFVDAGTHTNFLTFLKGVCSQEDYNQVKTLIDNLIEIRNLVGEISTRAEDFYFLLDNHAREVSYKNHSYYAYRFSGFSTKTNSEKMPDPWTQQMQTTKSIIENLKAEKLDNETYNAFKSLVMASTMTPKELFRMSKDKRLSKEDSGTIKKSYLKLANTFHPDKFFDYSESVKKEAEELFKLVANARDLLLADCQ